MSDHDLSPGDAWTHHYRGLTLHANADGDVWWRQYNGGQRLHLDDPPEDLVANLQELKPAGAMFRVTESNHVIAKQEDEEEGTYEPVYAGRLEKPRQLNPKGESDHAIELRPDGVKPGDLWPSIYDGARYSLTDPDRIWWKNPKTGRRHPVQEGVPERIASEVLLHKGGGGSFRITPWGDVITLIDTVPEPGDVKAQFANLPRVVQNIIQLRNDRGLDMLPVYVGNIEDPSIRLDEPRDLTDELTESAQKGIEEWIESLGPTAVAQDGIDESDDQSEFDDDPAEWATVDIERGYDDD